MRENFAFALPLNSPLRKAVNESLLSYITTEEWQSVLRQYLGISGSRRPTDIVGRV